VTAKSHIVRLYPDALTKNQTVDTSAVYVDGFQDANQFIASQVPIAGAIGEFWCTIKQNKVEQVIVLNEPTDEVNIVNKQTIC
jgi:protein tyrosine phosphatase